MVVVVVVLAVVGGFTVIALDLALEVPEAFVAVTKHAKPPLP